jgi:hypothetical protein
MDNAHTAFRTDNRYAKRDSTCGIEGESSLTSIRKVLIPNTRIAVARKTQQVPRISTHLMMAEKDLILNLNIVA